MLNLCPKFVDLIRMEEEKDKVEVEANRHLAQVLYKIDR